MSFRLLLPCFVFVTLVGPVHIANSRTTVVASTPTSASESNQEDISALLARVLDDGEALVWYLGHCGWAVKTRSRLLIFDYWEQHPVGGEKSLANGRINPSEIADLEVLVFVSHDHGDHYDPVILGWADAIPDITYVFGWDAGLDPSFVYLTEQRTRRDLGGMEVITVNHRFDGIPEVAYLVKLDGLVLYHSGDHASTSDVPNPVFADNIDYLSTEQDRVDLAFVSTFGRRGGITVNAGDLHTVEKLQPRVVFPMHHGGGEDLNQRFVNEVAGDFAATQFLAARHVGELFHYTDGRVRREQ